MATQTVIKEAPSGHLSVPDECRGHSVQTSLNYYLDPGDGSAPEPVFVGSKQVKNERRMVPHPVTIRDITGEEDKYTLDSHGFQLVHQATDFADFDNEEALKRDHFPEMEEMLKRLTGASRVHVFDHKVRRGPSDWHSLGKDNASHRGPLHRAHIDQSYDGARMVVEQNLPGEAESLLKKRYQIINMWRPLKTVFKDPLAVADAHSIPESDLVPASIIYPTRRMESFTILPNDAHRWFFKYRQRPEEVLLLKVFDSSEGVARRAPHTAFRDPDEDNSENRESLEVRSVVFYD